MGRKSEKRKIVALVSSASGQRTYVTTKNLQNTPDKLRLRKYDKTTRKHEWFEETKKSLGRNEVKDRKG
ncbi:MAG: 50S ribosomal protein L33 [Patescibacteria group bacterium]